MRAASRAASSSVYDDTGGCGAPGSIKPGAFGTGCCWGAALAEYQLLGRPLLRFGRYDRAALRMRALLVNGASAVGARAGAIGGAPACQLQQNNNSINSPEQNV